VIPVAAPLRVRDRLRAFGTGPAPLVHRGPDAVYLDVGGWCVGVVGTRATAVPCAVRTSLDTLPDVSSAEVRDGVLHLDATPLVIGRIVDVHVPPLVEEVAQRPSRNLRSEGTRSIDVGELVGSGDGLTPYGDDVLCGWLAVHRAAGIATPEVDAEVRAHLGRTTLLSATLLDCALHGEVVPEFAAFLTALDGPDEESCAATLEAVGHSSGRGLLEGARLALGRVAA
jgi:hypothetical protein